MTILHGILIGIALSGFFDLIVSRFESIDDIFIELSTRILHDLVICVLGVPGFFVASAAGESIVNIGYRYYTAFGGDSMTLLAEGIAFAVTRS